MPPLHSVCFGVGQVREGKEEKLDQWTAEMSTCMWTCDPCSQRNGWKTILNLGLISPRLHLKGLDT